MCVCVLTVCLCVKEYLPIVPVGRDDVVITSFEDDSFFIHHVLVYLLLVLHIHPIVYRARGCMQTETQRYSVYTYNCNCVKYDLFFYVELRAQPRRFFACEHICTHFKLQTYRSTRGCRAPPGPPAASSRPRVSRTA